MSDLDDILAADEDARVRVERARSAAAARLEEARREKERERDARREAAARALEEELRAIAAERRAGAPGKALEDAAGAYVRVLLGAQTTAALP